MTHWMAAMVMLTALIPGGRLWAASDVEAAVLADTPLPFYVYQNHHAPENHFAPSGWMGDFGDIRLDDRWVAPGSEKDQTAIRIQYSARGSRGAGWAGIYWQHPPNNWGSRPGGYNLNGAHKVTFRARGDAGGEVIDQFKVGGIGGDYADSGSAAIGPIVLTPQWQTYEISLEGQELSSISGGFCWAMNRDQNPKGATFYLDDIRYE